MESIEVVVEGLELAFGQRVQRAGSSLVQAKELFNSSVMKSNSEATYFLHITKS
ncbi:MAG: hypothetical protein IKH26_04885 [Bacteroidaceae bacterium]|nr:hypothetical protein [Bacteroidaceae bacterium]